MIMKKTEHKIFSVTLLLFVIIVVIGIMAGRAQAKEDEHTCYWTQCTTSGGKITGCWHYENGSKEKMVSRALELANKSGTLFFTECTQGGSPTAIDWDRKITGIPLPN